MLYVSRRFSTFTSRRKEKYIFINTGNAIHGLLPLDRVIRLSHRRCNSASLDGGYCCRNSLAICWYTSGSGGSSWRKSCNFLPSRCCIRSATLDRNRSNTGVPGAAIFTVGVDLGVVRSRRTARPRSKAISAQGGEPDSSMVVCVHPSTICPLQCSLTWKARQSNSVVQNATNREKLKPVGFCRVFSTAL